MGVCLGVFIHLLYYNLYYCSNSTAMKSSQTVRQRKTHKVSDSTESLPGPESSLNNTESAKSTSKLQQEESGPASTGHHGANGKLLRGSYWLTRIVFIRSLGVIYCKIVGVLWWYE